MKAVSTDPRRRQSQVLTHGLAAGLPLAVFGVIQPGAQSWAFWVICAGVASLLSATVLHLRTARR